MILNTMSKMFPENSVIAENRNKIISLKENSIACSKVRSPALYSAAYKRLCEKYGKERIKQATKLLVEEI